jgi:hypothetical protein
MTVVVVGRLLFVGLVVRRVTVVVEVLGSCHRVEAVVIVALAAQR